MLTYAIWTRCDFDVASKIDAEATQNKFSILNCKKSAEKTYPCFYIFEFSSFSTFTCKKGFKDLHNLMEKVEMKQAVFCLLNECAFLNNKLQNGDKNCKFPPRYIIISRNTILNMATIFLISLFTLLGQFSRLKLF